MKTLNSQNGFATLIALIMVGMLTLIGIAALSTSDDEVQVAANEMQEMQSFYAAESGLEEAAAALQLEYETTGKPPLVMPTGRKTMNDCRVAFITADDGPAVQKDLTKGSLTGLHALVKSFSIHSLAASEIEQSRLYMTQTFETANVPLFQFAIFYDNDLEIAPGANMVVSGRVHTNSDMYLSAGTDLQLSSYTTSGGSIFHGRKDGGIAGLGDVQIKDISGNYISMRDGAGWLDAYDAYWYDSSVSRWGGTVQDKAHGQQQLNVPLNNVGGDPHKLIERSVGNADSYENKATLKIIDNVAYKYSAGAWLNVTADMVSKGILSYSSDQFVDQREGADVDVLEVNIDKLYIEGYKPDNGVLYVSNDNIGDYPAVRLNNGSKLDEGLTIASSNPVYVNGDYNTNTKKPAAIYGDAVTFLSNNWNDGLSGGSKLTRLATATTVNAAIMTGNVETVGGAYSGGIENLPRFLETWTGVNFNYKGSLVNLWTSTQANSPWNTTYYSSPNRNWVYDTDFDDPTKIPPETPQVRVFQRVGWQQQFVGDPQGWKTDRLGTLESML